MASLKRPNRPVEILMVEDNPGDTLLFREMFKKSKFPIRLHAARDGIEALAFLRNEGGFPDAPRPDLILMDLNMPLKDGRSVLAEIKEDPSLGQIPVLILTSSRGDQDRMGSYRLKADFYIVKPMELNQLAGIGGLPGGILDQEDRRTAGRRAGRGTSGFLTRQTTVFSEIRDDAGGEALLPGPEPSLHFSASCSKAGQRRGGERKGFPGFECRKRWAKSEENPAPNQEAKAYREGENSKIMENPSKKALKNR